MNKFVGIPFTRHNELLETEKNYKALGSVKQASDALVKNQETQEFLQRKQEYKEKQEDIPKTLHKEIPTKAATILPPPSVKKPRKKAGIKIESFPIIKKFRDGEKRKPRQKKTPAPKKVKGLGNWQFIKEE